MPRTHFFRSGFIFAGLFALGEIGCGSSQEDRSTTTPRTLPNSPSPSSAPIEDTSGGLAATIEQVRESAVALEYSADGAPEGARRVASGVVISPEGDILSVRIDPPSSSPSPSRIVAQVASGRLFPARWVAGDPETGLTLLQIAPGSARPAAFSPQGAKLGMPVMVVGNPFGLAHSVGRGFVAGLNRRIVLGSRQLGGLIQIDAALHPGDSGALVTDLHGGWLGIVRSGLAPPADRAFESGNPVAETSKPIKNRDKDEHKREYDHDLGFAISARDALWVADQLRAHQHVDRAYLGVTMDLSASTQTILGASAGAFEGAVLGVVVANTPADKAGLLPGDRVIKVDNLPIRSPSDLTDRLDRTLAGSEIALEVVRGKGPASTHKRLVVGTSQRPTFQPPSSTEAKSSPPGEVKVSETSKTP